MTGTLPHEISNLQSLLVFAVEGNKIEGSVDFNIFMNMSSLQYLLLWRNKFTGKLSSDIGNLTTLTDFEVAENNMTG